eukprot:9753689-Karenia_brevis.AAC.1
MASKPKEEDSSEEWEEKVNTEIGDLAKNQVKLKATQAAEMKDLDRAYQRIQNLEASLQEEKEA